MTVTTLVASELAEQGMSFKNLDLYEDTKGWLDHSFSWVIPTVGKFIHWDVVDSWDMVDMPMNQARTGRLRAKNMEVADAYNFLFKLCVDEEFCTKHYNAEYSAMIQSTRFIWTTEHDNVLPCNALTGLMSAIYTCPDCGETIGSRKVTRVVSYTVEVPIERTFWRRIWETLTAPYKSAILTWNKNTRTETLRRLVVESQQDEELMQKWECANGHHGYDAVSGLYFLKTIPPRPMAYGNPKNGPDDFTCQPVKEAVAAKKTIEVNGIGMGCGVWRKDMFRKLSQPWFETIRKDNMTGKGGATQDLAFCRKAKAELGARFGVNCDVRVGHTELKTGGRF